MPYTTRHFEAALEQLFIYTSFLSIHLYNTYNLKECFGIPSPRYCAHSHRWFREKKAGREEFLSNPLSTGRFVAVLVKRRAKAPLLGSNFRFAPRSWRIRGYAVIGLTRQRGRRRFPEPRARVPMKNGAMSPNITE